MKYKDLNFKIGGYGFIAIGMLHLVIYLIARILVDDTPKNHLEAGDWFFNRFMSFAVLSFLSFITHNTKKENKQ